jgi:hypothetical protein
MRRRPPTKVAKRCPHAKSPSLECLCIAVTAPLTRLATVICLLRCSYCCRFLLSSCSSPICSEPTGNIVTAAAGVDPDPGASLFDREQRAGYAFRVRLGLVATALKALLISLPYAASLLMATLLIGIGVLIE